MASERSSPSETSLSGYRIGRERFAKISAVEGIVLPKAATERADDSARRGLTSDERRQDIIRRHGGK